METEWEELERWMENQRLPKGFERMQQPDWIDAYVRNMIAKALPAAASAAGKVTADIAETKLSVTVKFPLGENADLDRIRLVAMEDRIKLSGLGENNPATIRLPKLVLPHTCDAHYDGAVLTVRLRKRPTRKIAVTAVIRTV
ncbi:Hsp20/alpha crystallin family protein [Paenibacillus humicola]|uniref:Hsp20/alpha crystallin family protein n=1 Tax=Paenibacillus humicola TaxID=3110540 RepID=UPI00237BF66A|nr:Hsp20/alpha crystallin family protein [Paenibacillus humicola]